jgi:hypothetical protein
MRLSVLVLQDIFCKYLCNKDFLEKHNAENLQDFAQTQLDFEFFFDNCYQNVNADSYPDLRLDGIDAGAEKSFDSKILFDPFEKDFYSPATFVELGNCQCVQ